MGFNSAFKGLMFVLGWIQTCDSQSVCSADFKGFATSSQGIRRYISVMVALTFTDYF